MSEQAEGSQPSQHVTIPHHVVWRSFASETVLLNIDSGQYHGLNPVGGRMLEALQRVGDVDAAATELAAEFGEAIERVLHDLRAFCAELAERGLIELNARGAD